MNSYEMGRQISNRRSEEKPSLHRFFHPVDDVLKEALALLRGGFAPLDLEQARIEFALLLQAVGHDDPHPHQHVARLRATGCYRGREPCRSGWPGLEIRRILGFPETAFTSFSQYKIHIHNTVCILNIGLPRAS